MKKGTVLNNKYTIQFPLSENCFAKSFRSLNEKMETVRVDMINLASLPSTFFDDNGELIEIEILSSLNHSNVHKLIDSGTIILEKQKYAYLIFEFISGESLTERIKRDTTFTLYTSIPIVLKILEALEYLHNLNDPVIHNNITPDNIKLDYSSKKDNPILTGFEQARKLSQDKKSLLTKGLSVFYSAPELMNGIFITESDIFSVGALLYYSIFGIPPYYDESILDNPIDKQKKLLEDARSKPLNLLQSEEYLVDDQLKNILIKALSVDPKDRFKSAEEFSKALSREIILDKSVGKGHTNQSGQKKERLKGAGFNQIAGMEDLKKLLKTDVIDFLNNPDLYNEYGVSMLNGMLLYGPPGCGKTFIAEKFAEEVGYNFIMIKPSDVQSKYINATQENLGQLFKEAAKNSPSIIFIDELDAIVPSRESDLHQMHASAVNEVLAQMTNCGEKGIFVIGATNRPEKIDSAILRTGRLDVIVYVPPPDINARAELFKMYLKNRPIELDIDYNELSARTEHYVSSDIKFIIDEAARKSLKNRERISMNCLKDILTLSNPSVRKSEIEKFEALKEKWEKDNRSKTKEKPNKSIGFDYSNNK